MSGLTDFQIAVARLFFGLAASDGFVLAGGAALVVSGLTTRPTEDLDLFGERGRAQVTAASEQFTAAATERGWVVSPVQVSDSFVRLHVQGDEELRVDIAIDVAPNHPVVVSIVGPTFDPEELAGRKLVALFDRAEARDFADVFVLARRFDLDLMLARANEVEHGLDRSVLASMIRSISRFSDDELPIDPGEVSALRAFFARWADELD